MTIVGYFRVCIRLGLKRALTMWHALDGRGRAYDNVPAAVHRDAIGSDEHPQQVRIKHRTVIGRETARAHMARQRGAIREHPGRAYVIVGHLGMHAAIRADVIVGDER